MSTPYSIPIEAFFRRIEKDRKFFNYINMSETESLNIAKERAKGYLGEAIGILTLRCTPDVDFDDYDDVLETINVDCTKKEILIISSLMYQMYMDRDISILKCFDVNFTPSDLKVFDPSNARSTFKELYEMVCDKNDRLIDEYENKDRLTGERKGIDYDTYATYLEN